MFQPAKNTEYTKVLFLNTKVVKYSYNYFVSFVGINLILNSYYFI